MYVSLEIVVSPQHEFGSRCLDLPLIREGIPISSAAKTILLGTHHHQVRHTYHHHHSLELDELIWELENQNCLTARFGRDHVAKMKGESSLLVDDQ